jgi:hypothetical protein
MTIAHYDSLGSVDRRETDALTTFGVVVIQHDFGLGIEKITEKVLKGIPPKCGFMKW